MRLIDAEALKNAFSNMYREDYERWIKEVIDKALTVEERPKGKWKCFIGSANYGVDEDNEPIWKERKIYHCPFCNRRTVIKENFCPNCGASMSKGE